MKPLIWTTETAKKELARRLKNSKTFRQQFEPEWENNERALLNVRGTSSKVNPQLTFTEPGELGIDTIDGPSQSVGVNYIFKNHRFIHSQLSANPPVVVAQPTSQDMTDISKADAANRFIKYINRIDKIQEKQDQTTQKTLLYGTGWAKTVFDPHQGEIAEFDPESGEFLLEGKIDAYSPSTWDVWVDPDAREWEKVRYMFERIRIPLEEAVFLFPEYKDELEKNATKVAETVSVFTDRPNLDQEIVEVYEYWEKGLPINGMVGRYALHLEDGTVLGKLKLNPFSFSTPRERIEDVETVPVARLPYHLLTDIDIPDEVYGRSFIAYEGPIQDILNRLDNTKLEAIEAVGLPKLIIPETAEITEMSNNVWDVTRYKGAQPPHFMEVPTTMPDTTQLRESLKQGGDDMAGVNDAMFGQMQRETSGFSLQYASSQGSMIRKRLFNKLILFVESFYKGYLDLTRKHWKQPKMIKVLGIENAFESVEFKGADIEGGFDIVVSYGSTLSLDPMTRREEILQLIPLFEKAGIDIKQLLAMLKINDLEGIFDIMQLAKNRQKEIFEKMIATDEYIPPRPLGEHQGMLQYAYYFITTKDFDLLPEPKKLLIEQHIREREALLGQAVPTAPVPPGPVPGLEGQLPQPAAGGIPVA